MSKYADKISRLPVVRKLENSRYIKPVLRGAKKFSREAGRRIGNFIRPKTISRQRQDGHIRGTPQYKNRIKNSKPTSVWANGSKADRLTKKAFNKGSPLKGRPNVREYDFGKQIGTSPSGKPQSSVRVHLDTRGRIHGHPSGKTK